jgi:hypothetical protein
VYRRIVKDNLWGADDVRTCALPVNPVSGIETYYWLAGGTDDLPLYVGAEVRLFTKGDDGDPDAVPSAELEAIVQPDLKNISGPQFLAEREVLFFPGGADALLAWRNGDTSRRDLYLSGKRALMAAQ